MTHYQKLATMIFRIIGVFFFVLAAFVFAVALFFILFGLFNRGGIEVGLPLLVIYALPATAIGYFFFKLSDKLAKRICFDFDEQ